jgi:hypothetical protein
VWRLGVAAILLLAGCVIVFVLISGHLPNFGSQPEVGGGAPLRLSPEEFATPTEESVVGGTPSGTPQPSLYENPKDNLGHTGQTGAITPLGSHPITNPWTATTPIYVPPASTPLPMFTPYVPGVLAKPSAPSSAEPHAQLTPIAWPTSNPSASPSTVAAPQPTPSF